jgi:D-alanyl-D-alanine carboxypeptidase/D-alanyl-D-alanine-endopeptidase (penicillin-binding protein 4)
MAVDLRAADPRAEKTPLAAALDRALSRKGLRAARSSLIVVDPATGEILYERQADELLNPASVTKIVTSALALARLGPEHRFATDVLAAVEPDGEILKGDLFVRGSGDPKLVTETMYKLASNVAALGLREVRGNLVVDDSAFDAERRGPGWDQDDSDRPYQAPAGAASVNFNALEVLVYPGRKVGAPARVLTDPSTSYVRIENHARTVAARGKTRIRARSVAGRDRNVLRVRGTIARDHPGWSTWRKVDHPPLYFGVLFQEMLRRVGVTVRGKARHGKVPARSDLLTRVRSPQLATLLTDLNKFSQNFMAEQVLKAVGAHVSGRPGSWKNGALAAQAFLEEIGIPRGSYVFRNGSGLNDVNRMSARQVVRVLVAMLRRFPVAAEFLSSLAVAGADGSVKRRLGARDLYRRLRVKTGWLNGVSGLAGYVETRDRRTLAFALLINGLKRNRDGHRAQQEVARILAAHPDVRP